MLSWFQQTDLGSEIDTKSDSVQTLILSNIRCTITCFSILIFGWGEVQRQYGRLHGRKVDNDKWTTNDIHLERNNIRGEWGLNILKRKQN